MGIGTGFQPGLTGSNLAALLIRLITFGSRRRISYSETAATEPTAEAAAAGKGASRAADEQVTN